MDTQSVSLQMLYQIAEAARRDGPNKELHAGFFFARLCGHIECQHGANAANTLAKALGADHLVT